MKQGLWLAGATAATIYAGLGCGDDQNGDVGPIAGTAGDAGISETTLGGTGGGADAGRVGAENVDSGPTGGAVGEAGIGNETTLGGTGAGAAPSRGGATGAFSCIAPASDWLLCESFERGDGDFETWLAQSDFISAVGEDDRGRVDLSIAQTHSGQYALYMPAAEASGYQGASLDWRGCDGAQESNCSMRSYERLYFRAWIRFADDHRYVHHFLNIGGSQPDDYWYHGTAGCLPNGELSMGTTVDFRPDTHESHFYTYTPGMSCDTNCGAYADVDQFCQDCADKGLPTCDSQPQCCWGNHHGPEAPHYFPVGEWFCLEMMMQVNTVGESDGEMAYWVNDVEIHRETTMMWRTTPTLSLNRVRLQHYITTSDAEGHSNRVWFDDVVVSTERIGCD